jgi:hypothetical protein
VDAIARIKLARMTKTATLVFIQCNRCGHKAQRTVPCVPLPPEAKLRCSNCANRDRSLIKVWSTAGSSSARIVSFPKGKRSPSPGR